MGCYYIYAFDGRLLAEYDVYGNCLKEYIYMGSRLVAEYDPATSQYYYYTQDQIGSTRIVTDDAGAVVYAAAHDPYGGIQQTWTNAFDPKRKFSDKERDEETGLDYFGARYFANASYRWISVDPIVSNSKALSNTQLWNLYSFCRNNPIAFFDPDGRTIEVVGTEKFKQQIKEMLDYLKQSKWGRNILHTLEVSTEVVTIYENVNGFIFDDQSLSIGVDPLGGLEIIGGVFAGYLQSPAMGLIHECIHAVSYIENPVEYDANKFIMAIPSPEGTYEDFNEAWAVHYESRIAVQLNEPIRFNSSGYAVEARSPTYHLIGFWKQRIP